MKLGHLPVPAVRRLSLYLRQLETFLAADRRTVSSSQLGAALGLSAAQVRKDLAYFGQFGQPGVGYRVADLMGRVRHILGTDRTWNVLLAGVGNLGQALMAYRNFRKKGFRIVAAFDNDPAKLGQPVPALDGLRIQPLAQIAPTVDRLDIRLAALCVPAPAAQPVADALVAAGVKGLLNFAPVSLTLPPHVALIAVDLASHLEQLAYQVSAAGPVPH